MSSLGDVKNRKWGHNRGYLSVSGDMSHRDMLFSSFFSFFYNQILVFLLWILSFRRQPASATAHSHSCDTEPHRIGKAKLSEPMNKNLSTFDIVYGRGLQQDVTHYCSTRKMWKKKTEGRDFIVPRVFISPLGLRAFSDEEADRELWDLWDHIFSQNIILIYVRLYSYVVRLLMKYQVITNLD